MYVSDTDFLDVREEVLLASIAILDEAAAKLIHYASRRRNYHCICSILYQVSVYNNAPYGHAAALNLQNAITKLLAPNFTATTWCVEHLPYHNHSMAMWRIIWLEAFKQLIVCELRNLGWSGVYEEPLYAQADNRLFTGLTDCGRWPWFNGEVLTFPEIHKGFLLKG